MGVKNPLLFKALLRYCKQSAGQVKAAWALMIIYHFGLNLTLSEKNKLVTFVALGITTGNSDILNTLVKYYKSVFAAYTYLWPIKCQ